MPISVPSLREAHEHDPLGRHGGGDVDRRRRRCHINRLEFHLDLFEMRITRRIAIDADVFQCRPPSREIQTSRAYNYYSVREYADQRSAPNAAARRRIASVTLSSSRSGTPVVPA